MNNNIVRGYRGNRTARVLIIHTGGTIGMKKTENGYTPVSGYLAGELKNIPDLNRCDFPN